MKIEKYHGCGNDFLITKELVLNPSEVAETYCDRHTGIGADGMIFVGQHPLTMKIYNADGSEANMCGNGLRIFADYCIKHQIVNLDCFSVLTNAGYYNVCWGEHGITVEMEKRAKPVLKTEVLNAMVYEVYEVDAGVIHLILFMEEDPELARLLQERYPMANVNFLTIVGLNHITLVTYERGVGKTLSCGTGAYAAYYTLLEFRQMKGELTIMLPKGNLVLWSDEKRVYLHGPAKKIASCEVELC